MIGFVRGVIRIALFIIITVILVPVHYLTVLLTGSLSVTRIWHRCVWFVLGLRVQVIGADNRSTKQTLYVSNHVSYADIFVIGAVRDGVFVAKSEVESWPVFGYLATLQKTVFIRRKRSAIEESRERILARMVQGYDIILFPEGTSGDGREALPFKRALIPFDPSIDIQPVAVKLVAIDGGPVADQALRDRYAWYGDMEFLPHLWGLFSGRSAKVELHFLDPLNAQDFESVDALMDHAHQGVHSVLTDGVRA